MCRRSQKPALDEIGCEKVELDEMCKRADIISIHVAATPQTFHMLDKVAFEKMKVRSSTPITGESWWSVPTPFASCPPPMPPALFSPSTCIPWQSTT